MLGKSIGIKRDIGVDRLGLPHFIKITTANVSDRAGALQEVENHKLNLHGVKTVLADGGYTGKHFAEGVKLQIDTSVIVTMRGKLQTFAIIPQRWVIKRSFAWLEKYLRLWRNCEKLLNSSLHMVVLAFIRILLNRT